MITLIRAPDYCLQREMGGAKWFLKIIRWWVEKWSLYMQDTENVREVGRGRDL